MSAQVAAALSAWAGGGDACSLPESCFLPQRLRAQNQRVLLSRREGKLAADRKGRAGSRTPAGTYGGLAGTLPGIFSIVRQH